MPQFKRVKRSWKSKSRALTPAQKTQVKRIVASRVDYKTRFGTIPALPAAVPNLLTRAPSYDVSNIDRYDSGGADKNTMRIGDRIKITSIRLMGTVREIGTMSTIRVMLVQHKKSAGTNVVPNDVLESNSPSWSAHSAYEHNSPYTILYDGRFALGYQRSNVDINKVLRFKNPLTVEYNPITITGTPGDTLSGNIELLVCADTTAPGANPQAWLTHVVNFYDF